MKKKSWYSSVLGTVNNLSARKDGNEWFFTVGGSSGNIWGERDKTSLMTDFLEIPELNAVINYRARAASQFTWDVVWRRNDEPVSDDNRIARLIRTPNFYQSQNEFFRQSYMFRDIFGDEFIYRQSPVGMPQATSSMFSLPPQHMRVDIDNKAPLYNFGQNENPGVTYSFFWGGKWQELDGSMLIHLNDNKVNINADNYVSGTSKLNALTPVLKNIRSAYEARGVIIRKRGALGILSNGAADATGFAAPMDEKQKEKLQEEYKKYGLTDEQWQIIITNLNLKWQQMGVDVEKLKLFDETWENAIKICDAYMFPYELFGNRAGVTYENKKEAKKQLYADSLIPEALERQQALNRAFGLDNKAYYIKVSYSHIPILQEDNQKKADTLMKLTAGLDRALASGAITVEQYTASLSEILDL